MFFSLQNSKCVHLSTKAMFKPSELNSIQAVDIGVFFRLKFFRLVRLFFLIHKWWQNLLIISKFVGKKSTCMNIYYIKNISAMQTLSDISKTWTFDIKFMFNCIVNAICFWFCNFEELKFAIFSARKGIFQKKNIPMHTTHGI